MSQTKMYNIFQKTSCFGKNTDIDSMGQQTKSGRLRSVSTRYRYLFLLCTLCGGALFLLSLHSGSEMVYLAREPLSPASPTWLRRENSDDTYTIKTEGCTIPALRPFDPSVVRFVRYPKLLKPCPFHNYTLLGHNETHIWVRKKYLEFFDVPSDGNFTCCYSSFYRPLAIDNINSDNIDDRVQYESCIYFSSDIEVLNEFVKVSCEYDQRTIYEQYFAFAPYKPIMTYDNEASEIVQNLTNFNIIIMGIDAVSRLNFHRTMPKTTAYLKKKGAIEMLGYNKVGDNTFPNLIPMLLGIREADLKRTCWPNVKATFDNCPFIWEWFRQAGYRTALGEDSASLGTFNFGKVGFARAPTDYYLHNFMYEAEKNAGNIKDFNSFICMGNRYFYQVLLDYIENLTTTLRTSRLFGFFWEVTMSHDYLNYPMAMDDSYESFLIRLDEASYLDETILILLSDHGIRWGDIRLTKQGRLEERLPLVQILVPNAFRDTYDGAYNNLRENSRRLTTPFDIHATLLDLVNMESIENDRIKTRSTASYAKHKGISLFLPLPRNRTCKMAGIEDHWCTCHRGSKLPNDSAEANEVAIHLIRHLNSVTREYPQCAKLKLAEIVEVMEMVTGSEDVDGVGWREWLVVARVAPGGGVFEATLRHEMLDWAISGTVSRLNLYGDQSHCVHHYQLKLYCHCQ